MDNLYSRYLNNELNPEELSQFLEHLQSPEGREGLDRFMESTWYQMYPDAEPASRPVIPFIKRPWVRYAAAVLVIASAALVWYNKSQKVPDSGRQIAASADVPPGTNKAVLTLADGSTVILDSTRDGALSSQPGVRIVISGDGRLAYHPSAGGTAKSSGWNTLTTPRGGKFRITLADGTRVWMNAATSLRYPISFDAGERKVELSGEAYFEVAQNAKAAFKVVSAGQEVAVLGTSFNLNAYAEEDAVKTTLLDGSVGITATKSNASPEAKYKILKPGQQSRLQAQQLSVTDRVNVEEVIAWKNGQLVMQNLDSKALMRQIARWYDVDIIYEGELPDRRFGGIIDEKVYLSNVLDVLDAGGIRCRVEGKKLYVSSK